MVDSPGHFGRLLQAPYPLVFRLIRLIFSRVKTTKRPEVFIDVRGEKNEDRLTSLSMLRNLEMCPSSSCFLSRSSWCSSVSSFIFFSNCFALSFVWYNIHITIRKIVYSCHFFSPLRMRWCEPLRDMDYRIVPGFLAKLADFSYYRTTRVETCV